MSDSYAPATLLRGMAEALLVRDDLRKRGLMQIWLRQSPQFSETPQPETDDPRVLIAAAALVEELAHRANQEPPAWSAHVGALPEPFFVMERAERPGFSRTLCLTEAPDSFKRRNIFAPPNFLNMV